MARSPRMLLLATTMLVVVAAPRAAAQHEPATPPTYPDPSAILLPPVASGSVRPGRPTADLPLAEDAPRADRSARTRPAPRPRPEPEAGDEPMRPISPIRGATEERTRVEPAAVLRPPTESTTLRAADYEASRREPVEESPRRPAVDCDPYEYLTGRSRRDRSDDGRDRGNDNYGRRSEQLGDRFGDRVEDILGGGRKGGGLFGGRDLFASDHRFDCFISPTTNPFYFEDPRSVTELRPIFIYQNIPGGGESFNGGSAWFIGGQARIAFTDRFSVVVNKVGLSGFSPGTGSTQTSNTGLSELWLGPKFGIIQNPETRTLLSAGATFQIPLGAASVYQNTGKLSIVPYVSGAQELFNTDFGTFNGLASAGYSFSTNRDRSNFFYVSGHLDLNFRNNNRFYPFIEANWFSYTRNGTSSYLGVEGRDLANFGGVASAGSNIVTAAVGSRFRINKAWAIGGAFELPVIGSRDLFRYRFSLDIIWRY